MRNPWTVSGVVGVVLVGSALTLGAEQKNIGADYFKGQTARLKAYVDAYEAVEKSVAAARAKPEAGDQVKIDAQVEAVKRRVKEAQDAMAEIEGNLARDGQANDQLDRTIEAGLRSKGLTAHYQEFRSIGGMRPLLRGRNRLDADTDSDMKSILGSISAIRRRSPMASLLESLGLVVTLEARVATLKAKLPLCIGTWFLDCRK
jgi:hypothetical protein